MLLSVLVWRLEASRQERDGEVRGGDPANLTNSPDGVSNISRGPDLGLTMNEPHSTSPTLHLPPSPEPLRNTIKGSVPLQLPGEAQREVPILGSSPAWTPFPPRPLGHMTLSSNVFTMSFLTAFWQLSVMKTSWGLFWPWKSSDNCFIRFTIVTGATVGS